MRSIERLRTFCVREWPTLLVVGSVLLIELFLATRSFNFLIQNLLPDDAFFYFQVARNIVHGLGSTFDGVDPTNGYHPLWMLICVAVYHFFPTVNPADVTPIRDLLLLQVAMNAVTALLVAHILVRFSANRWIRAFGMTVFLLNPYLLYESLNGLETSLALMLFSLFFLLALRMEEKNPSGGYYFGIGFIGGLMILARLDMGVFYFAAFVLWIFLRYGLYGGWKRAALTCAGGFPVLLWLIWNVATFHMLLTSASQIETLMKHQLIVQDHGESFFQMLKAVIYTTQYELNIRFAETGMLALGCAFIGAFAALALGKSVQLPKRLSEANVASTLFLGLVALFVANASIRLVGRTWYYVSFGIFLAILTTIVCDRLLPHLIYKKTVATVLLAMTLFSFYVNWSKHLRQENNQYENQIELRATAEWLNANTPEGAVVGSFFPGIEGYFYRGRLIDLDGWIDNKVADAMQRRLVWQFMQDENVSYVTTYGPIISYRYQSFLGVDLDTFFKHLTLVMQWPDASTPVYNFEIYKVK